MTREKIIFERMAPDVTHLWASDKTILNRNSNTKEINKRKNANSQQNLVVFLTGMDSENKIS